MKFRIFCELLAKTMLENIDFTNVSEGYRRNEKPERLGIATVGMNVYTVNASVVEMKSPRDWALQRSIEMSPFFKRCRNEKPK